MVQCTCDGDAKRRADDKCQLGKSYQVANKLADAEIACEIYSTAGEFDLLVKFYVEADTDIGHFINGRCKASWHPGHPHHHHVQGVLSVPSGGTRRRPPLAEPSAIVMHGRLAAAASKRPSLPRSALMRSRQDQ